MGGDVAARLCLGEIVVFQQPFDCCFRGLIRSGKHFTVEVRDCDEAIDPIGLFVMKQPLAGCLAGGLAEKAVFQGLLIEGVLSPAGDFQSAAVEPESDIALDRIHRLQLLLPYRVFYS